MDEMQAHKKFLWRKLMVGSWSSVQQHASVFALLNLWHWLV